MTASSDISNERRYSQFAGSLSSSSIQFRSNRRHGLSPRRHTAPIACSGGICLCVGPILLQRPAPGVSSKFVAVKGTKADAQHKLRALLTATDKGMSLDVSRMTLEAFLERWLSDYAETHTAPRTVQGYRTVIRCYLVPALGYVPLLKLTPHHIQNLYAELLKKGLSPQTVVHAHRVLRQALKHALKWGLLMRNICDAVDPPRPWRKEISVLTAAGIQRFLDAASGSPYGPIFFLALYTGMRRSEVLGLKWSSVALARIHRRTPMDGVRTAEGGG